MEKCYKIILAKQNFENAGYNKAIYEQTNTDLLAVSEQISQDWTVMERNARLSNQYAERNRGKMSDPRVLEGYRKERIKDYTENLRKSPFYARLIDRGTGIFECKPDVYLKASTIDDYTSSVYALKGLDDKLKKSIELCVKLRDEKLNHLMKYGKTTPGKSLFSAAEGLVTAFQNYAEEGLTIYNSFKDNTSNAPYCFMKELPGFASISHNYNFVPDRDAGDPWERVGTDYINIYSMGRTAINAHCKDFVENHGPGKK